jgi:general L-amino acid transport system permease protein
MKKSALISLAILLAIALGIGFIGYNVWTNISRQGIATGFGFLQSTAGFAIIQTLVPYSEASTYGRAFVVGLLNTALVGVLAIGCATILGFAIGLGRLSRNWLLATTCRGYVETFRNIPLLLQIFFWYFAVLRNLPVPRLSLILMHRIFINNRGIYLPELLWTPATPWAIASMALGLLLFAMGRSRLNLSRLRSVTTTLSLIFVAVPLLFGFLGMPPISFKAPVLEGFNFSGGIVVIPELASMVLGLTVYTAAFVAEIVRAGVQAVPRGQIEAARSLGLSHAKATRLIVIPQALRVILPPLTSQYLNIIKNSSLAAAIGYPDLTAVFAGTVLNQTGQAVEVILITMIVYLSMSLMISLVMNHYQARTKWALR